MQRRATRVTQQHALRKWEHRQRRYARGAWFRLRRILAEAQEAFVLDATDGTRLLEWDFVDETRGRRARAAEKAYFRVSRSHTQAAFGAAGRGAPFVRVVVGTVRGAGALRVVLARIKPGLFTTLSSTARFLGAFRASRRRSCSHDGKSCCARPTTICPKITVGLVPCLLRS
jgi:hypothetical protein